MNPVTCIAVQVIFITIILIAMYIGTYVPKAERAANRHDKLI